MEVVEGEVLMALVDLVDLVGWVVGVGGRFMWSLVIWEGFLGEGICLEGLVVVAAAGGEGERELGVMGEVEEGGEEFVHRVRFVKMGGVVWCNSVRWFEKGFMRSVQGFGEEVRNGSCCGEDFFDDVM